MILATYDRDVVDRSYTVRRNALAELGRVLTLSVTEIVAHYVVSGYMLLTTVISAVCRSSRQVSLTNADERCLLC
jgi:hypothetical protein